MEATFDSQITLIVYEKQITHSIAKGLDQMRRRLKSSSFSSGFAFLLLSTFRRGGYSLILHSTLHYTSVSPAAFRSNGKATSLSVSSCLNHSVCCISVFCIPQTTTRDFYSQYMDYITPLVGPWFTAWFRIGKIGSCGWKSWAVVCL